MGKQILATFSTLSRVLLIPHQHFKFLRFKMQYSPAANVLCEEERKGSYSLVPYTMDAWTWRVMGISTRLQAGSPVLRLSPTWTCRPAVCLCVCMHVPMFICVVCFMLVKLLEFL